MTAPLEVRTNRLNRTSAHVAFVLGDQVLHDGEVRITSPTERASFVDAAIAACSQLEPHQAALLEQLARQALAVRPEPGKREKATQGTVLAFEPVDPWSDRVDGADLLDRILALLRQYLVLPEHGAEAVSLWIAHTYAFQSFLHTPRLGITSPMKRCGKSTLLSVLEQLTSRAMFGSHLTAATLFRVVEQYRLTLLIDEADTFLKDNDELRGVLNSGHAWNGKVPRCVGDEHEVAFFSTFAPAAIACIGTLPDTLADRAVPIRLRRRAPGERVEKFRPRAIADETLELRRMLTRWTNDHADDLQAATPRMPAELNDRAEDGWTPLLALADLAGGAWPTRGRAAAVALNGDEDEDGTRSLLLADLRDLLGQRSGDDLLTEEILAHLRALPERPWRTYSKGRELTDRQLASQLRPFGVRSRDIWTPVGARKGYSRAALEEVFARYLPNRPPRDAMPRDPAPDLGNPANVIRESSERLAVGEHPGPRAEPGLSRHRGSEGPVEYEL